jgi:hypothetical protein
MYGAGVIVSSEKENPPARRHVFPRVAGSSTFV